GTPMALPLELSTTTPQPLPSGVWPSAARPMVLPRMVLPVGPDARTDASNPAMKTPTPPLPEMIFRSAGVGPPMSLPEETTSMPWTFGEFGAAGEFPDASVPMLQWTTCPVPPAITTPTNEPDGVALKSPMVRSRTVQLGA